VFIKIGDSFSCSNDFIVADIDVRKLLGYEHKKVCRANFRIMTGTG